MPYHLPFSLSGTLSTLLHCLCGLHFKISNLCLQIEVTEISKARFGGPKFQNQHASVSLWLHFAPRHCFGYALDLKTKDLQEDADLLTYYPRLWRQLECMKQAMSLLHLCYNMTPSIILIPYICIWSLFATSLPSQRLPCICTTFINKYMDIYMVSDIL